jgi:Tfp pilus assembly protein PilO
MIPIRRAFDEKRRLVVPIAAGLALNIILYVGVVYPLSANVRGAVQRHQDAARELISAEQDDRAARGLLQGKDRTGQALQTFYKDVLPTDLSSARSMTYLHLNQMAEQHNLRQSHRNAEPELNPRGALRRLRTSISLEGSYDDVRQFIHELETGSDFIVIDSVTLTQEADPTGPLHLAVDLSTYYKYGT